VQHPHARLTPTGRRRMVALVEEKGMSYGHAATRRPSRSPCSSRSRAMRIARRCSHYTPLPEPMSRLHHFTRLDYSTETGGNSTRAARRQDGRLAPGSSPARRVSRAFPQPLRSAAVTWVGCSGPHLSRGGHPDRDPAGGV